MIWVFEKAVSGGDALRNSREDIEMYPNWNMLVRNLRMHAGPRRLTAMLSILTAFTLLFSFAASAQPVLAVPPYPDYRPDTPPTRPTVNGLFWGDRDEEVYKYLAGGVFSDSVLYWYVDPLDYDPLDPTNSNRRMFVAFVVDGNLNDNAFTAVTDSNTHYMESAGWGTQTRTAFQLMNSEYARFSVNICLDEVDEWQQGYARQVLDGNLQPLRGSVFGQGTWVSNPTIDTGDDLPAPPTSLELHSSSSIAWNLTRYNENYGSSGPGLFDMDVNCTPSDDCELEDWKSPFKDDTWGLPLPGNTVTTTGGFPEVISRTAIPATPLTHSLELEWEWPMVYEWSVLVGNCPESSIFVTSGETHHSPSKTGISDDPTPVTLTAPAALTTAALLPIAGLLVGVSVVIVAPRRRRRRD